VTFDLDKQSKVKSLRADKFRYGLPPSVADYGLANFAPRVSKIDLASRTAKNSDNRVGL
jgi:hypothetical protein